MSIWYKKVRLKYYETIVYVFGIAFIFLSGCKSKNPTTTDTPEIAPVDNGITKSDSTKKTNDTIVVVPNKKKKKDSTIKPQVIQVIHDVQAEYGVKPNDYEKIEQPANE